MSKISHAHHRIDIEYVVSKKITSRMMRMNVKEGAAGIYIYILSAEKLRKSDQLDLTETT